MRRLLATGTLAVVSALSLIACTADGGDYFDEMMSIWGRLAEATEDRERIADRVAHTDFNTTSPDDLLELEEQQLDAAQAAEEAFGQALTEAQLIVPPRECEEVHTATLEALQLSRQAFVEVTSYYEVALRTGRSDEEQLERGNELLADSYRARDQLLVRLEMSDCG